MAWFLSYLWKRPTDTSWQPEDATIIGDHPVVYIQRARRERAAEGIEYRLMFFAEVPNEEPPPVRTVAGAIPRRAIDVR